MTLTERPRWTPFVVVEFRRVAHVDVAALLDEDDAAVRPERVRRGQGALDQLLRWDHRINVPIPRAC